MTRPLLCVDSLSAAAGEKRLLDGVTLEVASGRLHALVGESGSGKTLIALSLLRLLPEGIVLSGSITFEGRPLLTLSEREARSIRGSGISLMMQEPLAALNPVLNVEAHVVEALRVHGLGGRVEAIALLREVGLDDAEARLASFPHQLSGGMRQRVLLAAALAGRPKLLIADEPTTALDASLRNGVLSLLKRLAAERQMAVLLLTHDLHSVRIACDDVSVMRAGAIVEQGRVGEVFQAPKHEVTRALLRAAALPVKSAARAPREQEPLLTATDLSIRFPNALAEAVSGVSLSLKPNEVLGIAGASGSGKSTLARMLLGLLEPTSGSVSIGGTTWAKGPSKDLRRLIQPVFQDPGSALNPRLTVSQSIAEPLAIHGRANSTVFSLLDAVQLDASFANRKPHQLSSGQKQRVNIARALALDPKILVLDEPVSALDVSVQEQILALLLTLQRQRGLSLVFISHDLDVISHVADRIAVMHEGRFVEQGDATQVLNAPEHPSTQSLLAAGRS